MRYSTTSCGNDTPSCRDGQTKSPEATGGDISVTPVYAQADEDAPRRNTGLDSLRIVRRGWGPVTLTCLLEGPFKQFGGCRPLSVGVVEVVAGERLTL